jgi:hypothetical protein
MTVTSYQVYFLDQVTVLPTGEDYSWLVSSWTFEGSNDGSNYNILSTVYKHLVGTARKSSGFDLFNCSSPASYKYYRFYVTANWFIDNMYSDIDSLSLIELKLIVKDSSPTMLPTALPTAMIILIVVLVIGAPLTAVFLWYSLSRYHPPEYTKSNPCDNSLEDINSCAYTKK